MALITGDEFDNVLHGTPEADVIKGLGGNDTINGYGGNDTLYGGDGYDYLNGGAGDDYIDPGSGNGVVTGSTGSDTIDYSNVTSGFGNLQYRDLEEGIVAIIDIDGDIAVSWKSKGDSLC